MTHPRTPADFIVVDARSGKVARSGTAPFQDIAAQSVAPHEIVLGGRYEIGTVLDMAALEQGEVRFIPAQN